MQRPEGVEGGKRKKISPARLFISIVVLYMKGGQRSLLKSRGKEEKKEGGEVFSL